MLNYNSLDCDFTSYNCEVNWEVGISPCAALINGKTVEIKSRYLELIFPPDNWLELHMKRSKIPLLSNLNEDFLKTIFGRNKPILWGHWYQCSGLLVMSALGFKTSVDPYLHSFSPVVIPRFTSGVTPAGWMEVNMAVKPFDPCSDKSCVHKNW